MNINAYLRALTIDPNGLYTPDTVEIPVALGQLFATRMNLSDTNVQEYGRSMYWQGAPGAETLVPNAADFIGGPRGNSADLQTNLECQRGDYIGDFHTHPYGAKYGAGIGVGPSNGDWDTWWRFPPQNRTIAVHFVASGGTLFMLIFRRAPAGPLNLNNVTLDATRLNRYVQEWDDFAEQDRYLTHSDRGNWVQARQMLLQHAPDAIRHHQEDAHQMNISLCNVNGCEYFSGPLRNGATTLALASNRVLGNWMTVLLWNSANDPWMRWPF
jgi:hypothetical protein